MSSLQAVTDSQGCGAAAANASFRVTFIVPRFFGAKPHPINEIVNLSEHSQQPLFLTGATLVAIKPWFQSSCFVFVIVSSARNAALDICQVSARTETDRT